MKLVDIVAWALNGFIFFLMIKSIILSRKTKKIVNEIKESNKQRYEEFVKEQKQKYDEFTEQYSERLNLLSKENNKLRSQNEELKERLRDLGITDFDVLN